jgi:hypothetical protein
MDKYKQFILDIIINRGRFAIPDGEYKERHHIIPKCMGGSDDEENLVDLLLREHIIAHKLLADIYQSCDGVQYAFWMMCNCREYDDVITPVEYEAARKIFSKDNPSKRPEVREKISKNNPMKRPEVFKKMVENMPKKPVEALDPKTGLRIHYFESTRSADGLGFNHRHVSECCNGKRKTHAGYIWRYVEGGNDDGGDN